MALEHSNTQKQDQNNITDPAMSPSRPMEVPMIQ